MDYNKLEKIKESTEKLIEGFFRLAVAMVNILIMVFIMLGSISAMILLYKMFPDTASLFMKPILLVIDIFFKLFYAIILLLIFLLIGYTTILYARLFKKNKSKREKERSRFLNDVVKKLKKELKK